MAESKPPQVDDLALALLLSRLTTQDETLDGIKREVRRTNGRVTALETKAAVADGKEEVRTTVRSHRAYISDRAFTSLMMLVSGALGGAVGHLLHFW